MADILIVDDHKESADTLALLLKLMGHNVQTIGDGRQAIEFARRQRPSYVLLDLGMPGLNGYEVATMLRQEPVEPLVIIAVTGYAGEDYRRQALAAGCDFFLPKPVNLDTLVALIAGSATKPSSPRSRRSGGPLEQPAARGPMD
jgi:CheY-like chemotaxis protein